MYNLLAVCFYKQGIVASFLGCTFSLLNKKFSRLASAVAIATIEMFSGFLLLTLTIPALNWLWDLNDVKYYPSHEVNKLFINQARYGSFDLIWIIMLSVICTNLPFFLSKYVYDHCSVPTITFSGNMEPVYGIAMGILLFNVSANRHVTRIFSLFITPCKMYYLHVLQENYHLNVCYYLSTAGIIFSIFFISTLHIMSPPRYVKLNCDGDYNRVAIDIYEEGSDERDEFQVAIATDFDKDNNLEMEKLQEDNVI